MQSRSVDKFLTTLILLFGITFQLCSQAITFKALSDAEQIFAGNTLTITYELNSREGTDFKPPKFTPFQITQGPSTQTSMTVVNGKMNSSMSYSYSLLVTDKPGKYTFPGASIKVAGKKYTSNFITVDVVPKNEIKGTTNEKYFVKLECDATDAYVGQQIILDYKLYTKEDVRSFDIVNDSEFEGFYSIPVNVRTQTKQEIINGQQYFTKVMRRKILFPQQTGTYTFGPFVAQLGIRPANAPKNGYFFGTRLTPVKLKTEALEIKVRDLPPTSSSANSNAVGKYSMTSTISENRVSTDDAITVNITVTGNGDAKFVTPPSFIDEEIFDVYDPNVTYDETFTQSNKMYHRKTFEYLAVPKEAGNYLINPQFQYFDTDSNKYITLKGRNNRISVVPGTGNKDAALLEQTQTVSLSPIATITKFHKPSSGLFKSIVYYLFTALCILAMLSSYLMYQKKKAAGELDPMIVKREQARKLALEKLSKALEFKTSDQRSAFYEEVIRAVKEYLSDKFNVPATYLNKSSIEESLVSKEVSTEHINQLQSLFNTCEINLYAQGTASDMDQNYRDAQQIIEKLEAPFLTES